MSQLISRWGAPVTYVTTVLVVGLTLVMVLLRAPDTRANFQESPAGYTRTGISLVGESGTFDGLTADLGTLPGSIYFGAGCANCHGLSGEGGVVGKAIWAKNEADILAAVRKGARGMPAFHDGRLTDEQISALATYLNDLRAQAEAR